jgi:hypothetical protein
MNETCRRIDFIAATVYAILVFTCGLASLVLGFILYGAVHVSESAPYFFIPGLILVGLSIFIYRGAAWAMILTAVLAFGVVLSIAYTDRSLLVLLAGPVVFAGLTAVCIGCRIKSRTV